MKIVEASLKDEQPLNELAIRSKQTWDYPSEWIEEWKKDVLKVKVELLITGRVFKAINENFKTLGYYALKGEAPSLFLDGLWIDPDHQRKGVGKRLFNHMMKKAISLGAKAIKWESDPFAELFYTRMGAKKIGERTYDLLGHPRTLSIYEIKL